MSFHSLYSKKVQIPKCTMMTKYTKLAQSEQEVDGYILPVYSFNTIDVTNDERKNITMHHYSLGNLKALGVDGQLKFCTAFSDTMKIADSFENRNSHDDSKVPSQDFQTGQNK